MILGNLKFNEAKKWLENNPQSLTWRNYWERVRRPENQEFEGRYAPLRRVFLSEGNLVHAIFTGHSKIRKIKFNIYRPSRNDETKNDWLVETPG